jgi:aminodeoxychorismate synthase component I
LGETLVNYSAGIQMTADIPNEQRYEDDISTIKNHQELGDIYQINYTHPKEYSINGNPFNLYLSLREIAKPLCGIYINTGKFQLLSASPERFFKTENNGIKTYPIKGTRKRSQNPIEDERIANELFHSEKDRAEHLMIVDLLRNDLGRICKFGSIKTHNLYKIESFETVHHMVTEVMGNLKNNVAESSIISVLFPGGSITGAPKERAMEIIDSVEDYNRNFYTGALGYISPNGDMDMNIAIRTMTITETQGVYPVGGGIVWDSVPKLEWEEAHHKGAIIDKLIHHLKENINV